MQHRCRSAGKVSQDSIDNSSHSCLKSEDSRYSLAGLDCMVPRRRSMKGCLSREQELFALLGKPCFLSKLYICGVNWCEICDVVVAKVGMN